MLQHELLIVHNHALQTIVNNVRTVIVQGDDVQLKEVIISEDDTTLTVVLWADFSATNVTVGDTLKLSAAKITLFDHKL
jgi:flagellar basal body P-ring protein FlgI